MDGVQLRQRGCGGAVAVESEIGRRRKSSRAEMRADRAKGGGEREGWRQEPEEG